MELSDPRLKFFNIYISVGDPHPFISDGTLKKEEKKVSKEKKKKRIHVIALRLLRLIT